MNRNEFEKTISEMAIHPSISEERGLELIEDDDLMIFSPGISTGGIAELRMAIENPDRKIIATTIDEKGYDYALENVKDLELDDQIEVKLENLTEDFPYPDKSLDFIYARLVLHYLSSQDLDATLTNFKKALKKGGKIFIVVRSAKNTEGRDLPYDPETKLTHEPWGYRYFHTTESITQHLTKAGFTIARIEEYQEQLYKDFMRKEISSVVDHVIEVLAYTS